MSKLKLDTGSLTTAMQKNPDFIPTLMSSLTALQQDAVSLTPSANESISNAAVVDNDFATLARPSDLRESVEAERRAAMIADALS